ncbi:hypothetical protein K2173_014798 [Erythroxylum novogranatense]|uniref:RING-type domain-containing protein n=1 Tax=Erythroxylum novogranatense TaxID=1862640 RepID=A0AAV8TGZ0_9ROSI|nr:hypothetical protein K2173_014798 [Erythroxylum novogranatense]
MAEFSHFFSALYLIVNIFFKLILLELMLLVRSLLIRNSTSSADKHTINTTLYLKLIEKENPTVRYTEKVCEGLTECAVCLSLFCEGESVRKLRCDHAYHKDCMDKWLQQPCVAATTCPVCRKKILPDEIVDSYRRLRKKVECDGIHEHTILLLSALRGDSLLSFF